MGNLPPEQRRPYQLSRYQQRMGWAKEYLGSVCVRCGGKENLEIDHIDPASKSFNISHRWAYKLEKLKVELDKCQLLCSSCHESKTYPNFGKITHGLYTSYNKKGCRCDICTNAWKLYVREVRSRNKS